MSFRFALGVVVLLFGCEEARMTADAAAVTDAGELDAAAPRDAPSVSDAPDESAASICPRYDAHARGCFGEMTGEDFLAECFALYGSCGSALPAVVRCRLESECAALGDCAGMGC